MDNDVMSSDCGASPAWVLTKENTLLVKSCADSDLFANKQSIKRASEN
jgi:hypothetical protein